MLQPDPTPWQAAAACAGLSPSVVFARRERQAAPALEACAACPVARECEEAVAPAESWFDGVCAGRLWRNGRAVKPRSPRARRAAGAVPAGDPFDVRAVAAQLDDALAGTGGTRG
ncbi:WhiB family transcriptional regulator [Streptomyces sp. NPDC002262]|uniref:WhiB family transcriptional regulator n=1 Tax=Streptomyces sp. NPDC002262 TaxID=3154414 RepID=UPI003329BB52